VIDLGLDLFIKEQISWQGSHVTKVLQQLLTWKLQSIKELSPILFWTTDSSSRSCQHRVSDQCPEEMEVRRWTQPGQSGNFRFCRKCSLPANMTKMEVEAM